MGFSGVRKLPINDRRPLKNIHSDNFHVELLSFTRLLIRGLLATVSLCVSELVAGDSLRPGIQPAAAGVEGDGVYGSLIRSFRHCLD
jgi:hypothetical protein